MKGVIPLAYKSIIALGRQYGSGGREIGEKLARMMDVPFYDRELIALAAQKSGIAPETYASVDETATNSLLYALSTGAFMFSSHFTSSVELPMNDKLYILQNKIINLIKSGQPIDYIAELFGFKIDNEKSEFYKELIEFHRGKSLSAVIKDSTTTFIETDDEVSNFIKNWINYNNGK